ncbi:MAG: sulfatase-like hydrolase/transferase [Balneolaceae bacterium]|nr:sulfatase-like hydrolase/transferase [Balneolaceae bacterium]
MYTTGNQKIRHLATLFLFVLVINSAFWNGVKAQTSDDRPNILWISTEDHNPALGAYGDDYAHTPNIDRFAEEAIVYRNAFVPSPICSPARSAIITGMHATSLGTQHLRSVIELPEFIKTLPELMRGAGYYTTNNVKTDYNFDDTGLWDESSEQAHWRNRESDNTPFFSVFNIMTPHEMPANVHDQHYFERLEERRDPDEAVLPPFFPDTPEMRKLWARYYDLVSVTDLETQDILDELEEDGLAEDTIVFFWSDHGFGLPRYKRWINTTGLEAALIVRVPPKYRDLAGLPPGSETAELITFIDLAPTVLSLAGIETPETMEGKPFLGEFTAEPRSHFVAHRDRADDVYDMARAVRSEQYMYIRNYMPHLPYIQNALIFGEHKRSSVELDRARAEGLLPKHGEAMYRPRPLEELFDVQADPWELNNLAEDPAYRFILEEKRSLLYEWILETRDTGFLQEGEMMLRAEGSTPYEMVNDPDQYDLPRIAAAANLVGDRSVPVSVLSGMLNDDYSGVRYWAAEALLARVNEDAWKAIEELNEALADESPSVKIKAAETLCMLGHCENSLNLLANYLMDERGWIALQAAISVRQLSTKAEPILDQIHQARINNTGDVGARYSGDTGYGGYSDAYYSMFIGFAMDQVILELDDVRER